MDFIPGSDSLFNNWVRIFVDFVKINFAALGLTLQNSLDLVAAYDLWGTKYNAHLDAQATAEAASQQKVLAYNPLETMVREFTKIIQANPAVTNDQKAALGITIPKGTKTPSPIPTTRPSAEVDNKQRLQQTIHFFDEGNKKGSAKPAGVRACEVWIKIGDPSPKDESEVKYLASDTKTPYVAHFDGADAGKTAHYMLRWVNTRSEPGPWSETISITISA